MIRVLEKNVAARIAAGEVVDRPLSVVKELVENSIDAGADSITVEIKNGGKAYIRVTDNGCGIDASEVLLAFKRHATSKIFTDKDLSSIETLGFRGEALASIAAVSRIELVTKTALEKTGRRVKLEGGEVLENIATGCPEGTTFVVTDLFYNTPARLKFMKSDAAESTLIIDFMSKIALAWPNIKIRLINNGNTLFATTGKGDVLRNILTVYDRTIGDFLLPLQGEKLAEDGSCLLSLSGYVSNVGRSKTNTKSQIFFVNGRSISSKVMEKGLAGAYADRLFEGRYPIAFLFLHVSPDKLDVNIHPNKKEVRFDKELDVAAFIEDTVKKALLSKESMPEIQRENIFAFAKAPAEPVLKEEKQVDIKSFLSTLRAQENMLREDSIYEEESPKSTEAPAAPAAPAASAALENEKPGSFAKTFERPFDFRELTITGSVFATYITAYDEGSFYFIDQHAAHERVFFEKLMREYRNEEKVSQSIMFPIIINTSLSVKNNAVDWLDVLRDMGFEIEEFGPKAFAARAIPAFMQLSEAQEFIEGFMENVSEGTDFENKARIEKIMQNSCKSAIKGNDLLKDEEIAALMDELAACENPYSCPHGRPTFIKITKYQIEKLFKRV